MIRNRISGMPVVNNKGLLTGIITKTDIVKTLHKEFLITSKK
jgi:CBS domain-containing protein